jgi:sec-independent protein translocase protein TatA
MLGGIGVQEIVIILIVGLLVFGASRLPKIARSLGQGIKEFKKTVKGLDEDEDEAQAKVRYVTPPRVEVENSRTAKTNTPPRTILHTSRTARTDIPPRDQVRKENRTTGGNRPDP